MNNHHFYEYFVQFYRLKIIISDREGFGEGAAEQGLYGFSIFTVCVACVSSYNNNNVSCQKRVHSNE